MTIKTSRNTVGMYGTKTGHMWVLFDFVDEAFQHPSDFSGKPIVVKVKSFDIDGKQVSVFNLDEDGIKEFAVGLNAKITELLSVSKSN